MLAPTSAKMDGAGDGLSHTGLGGRRQLGLDGKGACPPIGQKTQALEAALYFLAAKVEKAVKNQKHIMLFWESKLIHKLRGKTAVPNLHFVGDEKTEDGKMYHVMVMDMLGKSIEDLF